MARFCAVCLLVLGCNRTLQLPAEPIRPGSITLTLTVNGAAAAGARVRVAAAGAAGVADGQGAVSISNLPEGVYAVEAVSADGAALARVAAVTVLAGKPTALGSIALSSGGSMHGKVTGVSTAGAVVFVVGRAESALAGDDGSWRISGLPPGKYGVAAMQAGSGLARSGE